ncbi:folate-binding protein YgfZ [Termitidicoccus mucosus]|uniref:GCVT N-terminal domain-containing protein n=1 Tax=Termitidicoccus mucosus TaxID=1184151 RepID=A0A178IJ08_9BACT|nr:hypothetical protein AW736_14645 [Opitutaceae bacterium TSB47]
MIFGKHVRVFHYRPAAFLRISGLDAPEFLQGQFTQDLKPIGLQDVVYGLWLNQKGRVEADGFLFRVKEAEWVLASYEGCGQAIRERLERYIVADDVVVEDETARWNGVCLLDIGGPVVSELRKQGGGVMFRGRRGGGECWEWLRPVDAEPEAGCEFLSEAEEVGFSEMERRRIEAGVPMVPRDAGPGDLPNEAGLERDAISYTKGCYLGQEVISRLKSLGRVRRRLWRVRWEEARGGGPDASPERVLPAGLFAGGRKVGELRSMARTDEGSGLAKCMGLAMLSVDGAEPGALLSWSEGGEAAVGCEFPV